MFRSYEDLANAIVLTAANDYRSALKELNVNPRNKDALKTKAEVERFFWSSWFKSLTSLDPDILMNQLIEEVAS